MYQCPPFHALSNDASRPKAEYLPLPASSSVCNGNLVLLANILGSLLPNTELTDYPFEAPKTFGITMTTEFWNDVVWNVEEAQEAALKNKPARNKEQPATQDAPNPVGDETKPPEETQKAADDPMTGIGEEDKPPGEKDGAIPDVKMADEGTIPEVKEVPVDEPESPVEDEDIFVCGSELMAPPAEDGELEAALRSAAQILLGLRHDGLF